jgi:hypothetical protein
MSNANVNAILDPRGTQEQPSLKLAPRASMDQLKKGPVLIYDNTKFGFVEYMEVVHRIKHNFAADGVTNVVEYRETVRGKDNQTLIDFASWLKSEFKPAAVILGLGDMGTSPATAIITIALEELGIPSLYITAPPGSDLVKGVVHYRAGQLCLTSVDMYQGNTVEEIDQKVDDLMPEIYQALTGTPEQMKARANVQFELDGDQPDGIIKATNSIDFDTLDASEPAAGIEEINDLFNELKISDGLPIIPPTQARFGKMMGYCPYDPNMVLAEAIGPSGKNITVRDVAVAAIMAGCKPQAMPILVASFQAMSDRRYNFLQSVTTSHPGGNMLIASGPLAAEIGMHGRAGCIGPGFAANATIGRAINLVLINTCRSVPGYSDLACISSQAELTYAFSEDSELTPWQSISEERYDAETSTVFMLKAEPPHDIIDFLSMTAGDLLDGIVDSCTTLGSNNSFMPGPLVVVCTRDHAWLLHRDGFTKDMVREHIHKNASHPTPMVRGRGLVPVRPKSFANRHPMPVTREPKDVEIIVAGGRGGHSAVILPWALHSESIVLPVLLPDGSKPKSIEDFRS